MWCLAHPDEKRLCWICNENLAGNGVITSRQIISFPKLDAKENPHVGATPTEGTSHQAGTSGATIRDDAMRPAVPLFSAVSGTRPVRQSTNRPVRHSSAIPLVTKGQTFDTYGTIVGVNHEKKFAFIRTPRHTTDFYVGRQQYHRGMAVGDEVSFGCELEPRYRRRRRCPEVHRVELLARAWTPYRRPYGAF